MFVELTVVLFHDFLKIAEGEVVEDPLIVFGDIVTVVVQC